MNRTWDILLTSWENMHFTAPLWFLCAGLALIIGLRNYQNENNFRLFITYIIANLVLINIVFDFLIILLELKYLTSSIFREGFNTVFALVELTVFLFFFRSLPTLKYLSLVINIVWLAFFCVCLYFLSVIFRGNISVAQLMQTSYLINCIEFFVLLTFCLLYFYTLLTKNIDNTVALIQSPSFWIISGLFFYSSVSLPTLLIAEELYPRYRNLYFLMGTIHYLSISILLLCITKAFKCRRPLTT